MVAATAQRTEAPRVQVGTFQRAAVAALNGPATHVLIYGGSGSSKTYTILTWLVLRAMQAPGTTHAILRFHFTDLQASIIDGTLPAVCKAISPARDVYEMHKPSGAWHAEFVGGSRIYFGGLDDAKRTEKILGQEHSTIYLNESSQISYSSFGKAGTRVRQPGPLPHKLVCDENPPLAGHWTERLWIKGLDPDTGKPLANRADYAVQMMHPRDNPYLSDAYKARLERMSPRDRVRFWDGLFAEGSAGALWTYDSIEKARVEALSPTVTLSRVIVAVDPSGCRGPEDKRSDEVGIVAVALGSDGAVYVLEDASGRYGPGGDEGWGARVIQTAVKWGADAIYGERNFGGAMVQHVVATARTTIGGKEYNGAHFAFHEVNAASGKTARAEPVGTLTARGGVKFLGHFPELEDQLSKFTTAGYIGEKSPDRADAFVWGAYALGVVQMPGQGYLDWVRGKAEAVEARHAPAASAPAIVNGADLVELAAPEAIRGTYMSRVGKSYYVNEGKILALPEDVAELRIVGFT
jgi:phage terminase large subunit-like protein